MTPTATVSFATCDLCDAHKNDSSGEFRVFPPVFKDFGGVPKFSGPIVTVKCFEDNSQVKAAVDSAGAGRVLVVDGGASLRRALLGGNLGAAAARNG
ncbi:MAG: ribonuclease, partial [Polaromonas sp.]